MRKLLFFLLPVVLAIGVFCVVLFIFSKQSANKGGLQVTSLPQSSVYLNGRLIGKTPLCKCDPQEMLPIGQYTIRLVPVDPLRAPYEDTITINPLVLTVVDRTFGDVGKESGSIISLNSIADTKVAQLFVDSIPSGADVFVDSNTVGKTPTLVPGVTDSDHEVTVTKAGYASKTVRIHTVLGYKLQITVTLPTDLTAAPNTPQPTASPSASPTPGPQVTILQTPTGFLRVRDNPSLGAGEIAQVHPGETYSLISSQDGWFEIQLPDNQQGWISSSYAKTNQ